MHNTYNVTFAYLWENYCYDIIPVWLSGTDNVQLSFLWQLSLLLFFSKCCNLSFCRGIDMLYNCRFSVPKWRLISPIFCHFLKPKGKWTETSRKLSFGVLYILSSPSLPVSSCRRWHLQTVGRSLDGWVEYRMLAMVAEVGLQAEIE